MTIRYRTGVITLHEEENIMRMYAANVRKLWKLMFGAARDNEEAIESTRTWLQKATAETKGRLVQEELLLKEEYARAAPTAKYAAGRVKALKAKHEKTIRLQKLFNEMAVKAKY